jgi:hypothetical protein
MIEQCKKVPVDSNAWREFTARAFKLQPTR